MEFDHLIGRQLKVVKDDLSQNYDQIEVIENCPPGSNQPSGNKRVVLVKKEADLIKVIWSYEQYD